MPVISHEAHSSTEALAKAADRLLAVSTSAGDPQPNRKDLSPEERKKLNELASELVDLNIKIDLASAAFMRSVFQGEPLVMITLYIKPQIDTPQSIASLLGISRPRVTQIVAALEERDHVTKKRDERDLRRVHIALTEKGTEAVEQYFTYYHALQENYLMLLGPEDAEQFVRIHRKTAKIFDEFLLDHAAELLRSPFA